VLGDDADAVLFLADIGVPPALLAGRNIDVRGLFETDDIVEVELGPI